MEILGSYTTSFALTKAARTCPHGLIQSNLGIWRVFERALIMTTINSKQPALAVNIFKRKTQGTGPHTLGGIQLSSWLETQMGVVTALMI